MSLDTECALSDSEKLKRASSPQMAFVVCIFVLVSVSLGLTLYALERVSRLEMEVIHLRSSVKFTNFDNIAVEDFIIPEESNEIIFTQDSSLENIMELSQIVENNRIERSVQNSNSKTKKYIATQSNTKITNPEPINKERTRRNIIDRTPDRVPIYSESFMEAKRKNDSQRTAAHRNKLIADYLQPPPLESELTTQSPGVTYRRSRVMSFSETTRSRTATPRTASLRSADDEEVDEFTVSAEQFVPTPPRRKHHHRNRNEDGRNARLKSLAAVHLDGDTSKYVFGHHVNFFGNGHLQHTQRTYSDWKESDWVKSVGMGQHFDINNGIILVRDSGLYLVYAQIYYVDKHDTNGFMVYKNEDTLLQCTITSHHPEGDHKANTCYTAGVAFINSNDEISIRDLADSRSSIFEPGKSFYGLVKLGDIKMK